MSFVTRLFNKSNTPVIKPIYHTYEEWYLDYRIEMAKKFDTNYSICIASWTFSENHKRYFDRGLTPKEAVAEYTQNLKIIIQNNY